ncbi:MAG: nitrile hydratase accessory protein [Pseudomonadota bacterium]
MSAAEPVFQAPWEAKVFALREALIDRDVFTSAEWAETLGAEIAQGDLTDNDEGTAYYRYWMRALERLMAMKGLGETADVDRLTAAWQRAAEETPHGNPIELTRAVSK